MNNFDWEAFDGGKLAYNAKTEEDAKAFLAECEKRGLRWFSGKAPTEHHFWHAHKENTCYGCEVLRLNRLIYSSSDWFREGGLAICSEPWNAPSESVVDMLRSITAEQSYQCALCKRIYGRTEPGCPDGVECGDVVGHLAEMVEAELEEAKRDLEGFIPLPVDQEGKPWKVDDACEYGGCPYEVAGFDGVDSVNICNSKTNVYVWVDVRDIKRTAPKVLDAYGVEIKEEETLYGTGREQHCYTVQIPYSINEELGERFCVQCYDHDEGNIVWCDPSMLTHREPDSLNHVLADMMEDNRMRGTSYIPRITALIERGAK